MSIEHQFRSGAELHGDDLEGESLARWYEEEALGYYQLHQQSPHGHEEGSEANSWSMLNRVLCEPFVRGRTFDAALAYGCANGSDMLPFAGRVRRFECIEPQQSWWKDRIGDVEARYQAPGLRGELNLGSGTIDIVFCFGVLHHVAKVSCALAEIARVMKPGAVALLREPCSSMGDWSKPRVGATRNERGIPRAWMLKRSRSVGLTPLAVVPCSFGPIVRLASRLGIWGRSEVIVRADLVASRFFAWNDVYFRTSVLRKLAPGSYFYALTKR